MVHVTISPPGPWDPASRATTALAKLEKREVKWQESLRKKKIPTLDFISLQLTGSVFSQSLGISCVFSEDMCVLWQRCDSQQKMILHSCFVFFRGEMKKKKK